MIMKKKCSPRRSPQRSCIVCHMVGDKASLVRLVRTPTGEVKVDVGGRSAGRGAYLCYATECLENGLKKGRLEHALSLTLTPAQRETLWRDIVSLTLDRR